MYKTFLSRLFIAVLATITLANAVQAQDARTSIQNLLARLAPNKQLPADLTLTGDMTDPAGTVRPFRITIKGKDQVRYEIGTGSELVTTTHSRGAGWRQAGGKVEFLQPYSAIRRPNLVPFLDLLAEADTANLQITDQGNFSLGSLLTRRFTLKLPDPAPDTRLFRRGLDEETDFYIDPTQLLVIRSESSVTAENNPLAKARSVLDFADYRTVGGFAIPFLVRNSVLTPGQRPSQWTYVIHDATVNSGVPDSTFVVTGEQSR